MSKTLATAASLDATHGAVMSRRRIRRLVALAAGALALLPAPLMAQPGETPSPAVLAQITEMVRAHYLLPVEVDGASVQTLFARLDPQTYYLSPSVVDQLRNQGPVVGVGVSLLPASATPAPEPLIGAVRGGDRSTGVRPGDTLVAIDGRPTAGQSVEALRDQLLGPPQTKVRLTVRRRDRTLELVAERAIKPVGAEIFARRLGTTGYVRIDSFDSGTGERMAAAVKALRAEAPDFHGLILDLRDCPGGLLSEAVLIADEFLTGGPMVTLRGRDPRDVVDYKAKRGELLAGQPLVVLVNARTVAGAEIVAGALQERGRARLVGMPTYGNGLIQTVIPLNGGDDGALRVTTSAWYLPSGRPLQKSGVIPDVAIAAEPQDLLPQPREAAVKGAIDAPAQAKTAQIKSAQIKTAPADAGAPPELPPAGYDLDAGDYQLERALQIIARQSNP